MRRGISYALLRWGSANLWSLIKRVPDYPKQTKGRDLLKNESGRVCLLVEFTCESKEL